MSKNPLYCCWRGNRTPQCPTLPEQAIRPLLSPFSLPSREPTNIHPGASVQTRRLTPSAGKRSTLGAVKHPCFSRLLRYSGGACKSLPPPPRPPPLCCEVGNRTRHAAKCSRCDTSIIQRWRRAYCYHSATHYRHTHIPPKTSIVYISSTVRNRTSSFFENHQRWPLL